MRSESLGVRWPVDPRIMSVSLLKSGAYPQALAEWFGPSCNCFLSPFGDLASHKTSFGTSESISSTPSVFFVNISTTTTTLCGKFEVSSSMSLGTFRQICSRRRGGYSMDVLRARFRWDEKGNVDKSTEQNRRTFKYANCVVHKVPQPQVAQCGHYVVVTALTKIIDGRWYRQPKIIGASTTHNEM